MITTLIQFTLLDPISLEEAQRAFSSTAPKYAKIKGLIRKYYLVSQDGGTAGGVYLWKSKEDAERLYTEDWKKFIQDRYGSSPTITYFNCPVIVDNLTEEIISDV
jgi:hypothetical protein